MFLIFGCYGLCFDLNYVAATAEIMVSISCIVLLHFRSLLRDIQDGVVGGDRLGGSTSAIGGAGETFFETRKRLLSARERRIKDQLETLRAQRQRVRINREKRQIPVISVVGYTNAGKIFSFFVFGFRELHINHQQIVFLFHKADLFTFILLYKINCFIIFRFCLHIYLLMLVISIL